MDNKYVKSYSNFKQYQPPSAKKRGGGFFSFFHKKNERGTGSHYISNFTPREIKPTSKNRKKRFVIFLLAAVIIGWLGLMLYLPYFRVSKLSFEGLKIIDQTEMENYLRDKFINGGFIIPKNNYFLIKADKIGESIAEKYAVETVAVTKIFPGEIKIIVKEKISTIIYDNGTAYSLLDKSGTVVKILYLDNIAPSVVSSTPLTASSTLLVSATTTLQHKPEYRKLTRDYGDLPILYDARGVEISENKLSILPSEFIQALIDWQAAIKKEGIGQVKYFETDNLKAGVTIYLDRPWKIFIQPENSLDEQINNLKTVIAGRDVHPVEYIDLRYGERVFWK